MNATDADIQELDESSTPLPLYFSDVTFCQSLASPTFDNHKTNALLKENSEYLKLKKTHH